MYAPRTIRNDGYAIDTRSDTVTRPDAGMRAAMAEAEVGDDVYGEDPCVNRLEATLAERLGKQAGLFLPSGTMSNLCAMLAHCARGEEVLTGWPYHVFDWEARGAGVLGGVALSPLPVEVDGGLSPDAIRGAIGADDSHKPVPRLLCLENTHHGTALSLPRMTEAVDAARARGLSTHLDGARFFNAVIALGCTEADLARPFDSVSVCLSKGLGTPVGSVLVGAADVIDRARRLRKMLGGGMRQAGVLAAAGLYALEHNLAGLADDHARSQALAAKINARDLGRAEAATNMVWAEFAPEAATTIATRAAERNIALNTAGRARIVLHRGIDAAGFEGLLALLDAA